MNLSKFHYQVFAFPIFLMVVVFILWASLMKVGEFVRGQGKIVPSGQVKQIQHLEGGIVSEIAVKQGQQVKEGQLIYRIKNEFALSSLTELQINLYAKLATEARLRTELVGGEEIQFPSEIVEKVPNIVENEKKLFVQRKENFHNSLSVLDQQIDLRRLQLQEERARTKNLQLQYQYTKEQQDILERIVKSGAGSQKELIDSRLRTQNLLTDLEDLQNRMISTEKSIGEASSRLDESKSKMLVDIQTELSSTLIEIEKLKENISANMDRVSRTDIVSPVDGVVKALQYNTIGGIIKAGETIAEIIPSNEMLLVEASIMPQDRGRIWNGQEVNIKVTAYDSAIYGQLKGNIVDISGDTFMDEGTRMPYYAVKIESTTKGFGGGKPIYPGMVAEVDIVSGERTVMSYIMKPILRVFNNALSEP